MSRSLKETSDIINSISPSFCAAKWYNVSIWLGNGRTASCHHPLAHYIPKMELDKNPSAVHNTKFKKERRKEMLEGVRPAECSYCWTAEDAAKKNGEEIFSDRVYQSDRYTTEEILAIKDIPWTRDVIPKTVELAFDNLCNLACSYCNAEFSSTWARDIGTKGPYEGMITSGGKTFENDGSHAMPFGNKNEGNTYVEKFFEWFPMIRRGLQELRVSGGEPSRSPSFWRLLDICDNDNFDFAVNSNLIMDEVRLQKLIDSSDKFKSFDIYTSAECGGKLQEFVRDGFDWKLWEDNMWKVANSGKINGLHIMMTVSVLSVWTIHEFLKMIIEWRKKIGHKEIFYMSVNIARFPSFQNVNIIEQSIKNELADKIESALNESREWMHEWEQNHYERLIVYLRNVVQSYEDKDTMENKRSDFKNFIQQYSKRRNKPLDEYLPEETLTWLNNI
jgi:hypothetical protein